MHVRLVDDTWRGGRRRRFVSEIRQVVGSIENDRPVTHLTYSAEGAPGQAPGFFPDAGFAEELAPFRRELRSHRPSVAGRAG